MSPVVLPHEKLDRDAVQVIAQLQRAGYVSYLVGGCVRDLLLGESPKDFDIATDALPEQLKDLFGRRCRLIGRRFKLAHVRSGSQVFEVATFRGRPESQESAEDSEFVVRANTFGSPVEDALSRDFTINGLFYDPISGELHDHVGGLADIEARTLRTIGDAEQRFREDPVRLLRAVKFAGRLGLGLDDAILGVTDEMAPLVHDCPVARVTEEFYRLVESGASAPTLRVIRQLGLIDSLLPEIGSLLEGNDDRWESWLTWLEQVDRLVAAHGVLPRESTFVLVTWPLVWPLIDEEEQRDWGGRLMDLIRDATVRMAIPVRHRQALKATANVMRRLVGSAQRRRRRSLLLRSPALPVALTILRVRFLLGEAQDLRPVYEEWGLACEEVGISTAPIEVRIEETDLAEDGPAPRGKRPRRRGRKRRDGGGEGRSKKSED